MPRSRPTAGISSNQNYSREMINRFSTEIERRRRRDSETSAGGSSPDPKDMRPIGVESVDFHAKENSKEHHTDQYELVNDPNSPTPVLRRGLHFFLSAQFDRPFDSAKDIVRFSFGFGPKPIVTKGTRVILPLLPSIGTVKEDKLRWNLSLYRQEERTLIFQVFIPASAQVGMWRCSIQTNIKGQRDERRDYKCDDDLYILFNPWCRDDLVYMEGEAQRKEYVLNETGKVWVGSYRRPTGRRWVFGQFDDVVLPATVYLMEQSGLPHTDRGSPVLYARAISAVINSLDDNGLLVGKWDGDYGEGTSPHAWTGTAAILEKYLSGGGRPVRYGQCWVFSAATVTVCRALGLPCRSVTNYVSAHDTNRSLTVDKYFDKEGNEIMNGPDGECSDACWNFHVWNDVWMARPDLPAGFGGWQIIDATPQETSDGIYCCGPASVEAVRKGEVGLCHDTPFVFAEVNADVCHFQEDAESDWGFSRLSINQYHVGRRLITKRFDRDDDQGDGDMLDVTTEYKNPEGSAAERLAVLNAVRGVPKALQLYDVPARKNEDVFFDLVDIDAIPFGQGFDVIVHIQNKANDTRTIAAMLSASSVYYTGQQGHRLKKSQGEFAVRAGQRETLKLHIAASEYVHLLVDHGLIKIYGLATVKETKQTWSEEDDFFLLKPKINIQVKGMPKVGHECHATFSFQNPVAQSLTDCVFIVEGPGLQRSKAIPHRDVLPGETVLMTEPFTPRRTGETKVVATFSAKELTGVSGSTAVDVMP